MQPRKFVLCCPLVAGSIELAEIKRFFDAMGIALSHDKLVHMFHSIGKEVDAELDIVRLSSLLDASQRI